MAPEPKPGHYHVTHSEPELIRECKQQAWDLAIKCRTRVLYYDETLATMGARTDRDSIMTLRIAYSGHQRRFEDLHRVQCTEPSLTAAIRSMQNTERLEKRLHPQRAQDEITPVEFRWQAGVVRARKDK